MPSSWSRPSFPACTGLFIVKILTHWNTTSHLSPHLSTVCMALCQVQYGKHNSTCPVIKNTQWSPWWMATQKKSKRHNFVLSPFRTWPSRPHPALDVSYNSLIRSLYLGYIHLLFITPCENHVINMKANKDHYFCIVKPQRKRLREHTNGWRKLT